MQYFSHNFFADAEADYEDARYVIFGVPYDGTTSFRAGCRHGPEAIRKFSYNFETYVPSAGVDLTEVPAIDMGDLEPSSIPGEVIGQVRDAVGTFVRDGKIPVMLGGEHTITVGAVQAVRPDCYVVCDAHLDLREEYGGTPDNHACVTRRVYSEGVRDIFIIGARSGPKEEYEFARRLHLYTADDVRERGIEDVLEEIRKAVGDKSVYLSLDADAVDCCLTPGLGTPEPFGLTPLDLREVVRVIGPLAVGFDYNEVCPIDAGQTAAVAARLVREFLAVHWNAHR
jgi:agmatinase